MEPSLSTRPSPRISQSARLSWHRIKNARSAMFTIFSDAALAYFYEHDTESYSVLCAAKDETSVDIMDRMFCCNFLRKSRL
jgi:hypothetical protein